MNCLLPKIIVTSFFVFSVGVLFSQTVNTADTAAMLSPYLRTVYADARYQPKNGLVTINGGIGWTTNGWTKGLKLGESVAMQFGSSTTNQFGIGNSGGLLYFLNTSTDGATGDACHYSAIVNASGQWTFYNSATFLNSISSPYTETYGPALNNVNNGRWNPIASAAQLGFRLFNDEEFTTGNNSIVVYDNNGTGHVTLNRVADVTVPNRSGYKLTLAWDGIGTPSPGLGGFVQSFYTGANKIIVQKFRAKIPVGFYISATSNSIGNDANDYFITPVNGTGKYEDYIRVTQSGSTGNFSTCGFVYVQGSGAWSIDIASCSAYEVESSNIVRTADNVSFGTGNFSGNVTGPTASFANSIIVGSPSRVPSSYALAVNGNAYFTKATVMQNINWPDYVFNNDYSLPKLPELASFLKTNHHLPEMPSAAEIERNGIDIGNNQALLLKKIEELTLLLIEQNKTIADLNKSVVNQKAEMSEIKKDISKLKSTNNE